MNEKRPTLFMLAAFEMSRIFNKKTILKCNYYAIIHYYSTVFNINIPI